MWAIKILSRYVCSKAGCTKRFSVSSNVRRHERGHQNKTMCPHAWCQRLFKTEAGLRSHACGQPSSLRSTRTLAAPTAPWVAAGKWEPVSVMSAAPLVTGQLSGMQSLAAVACAFHRDVGERLAPG
jgi:hypothetical protein